MDTSILGKTGIEVSRLCFGTGTAGWGGASDQTRLGKRELADLLIYAYSKGVTFWDLADQYGSHTNAALALQQVDRSDVVLTSKTTAKTKAEAAADIDRFLDETNTDYIDVVLMHCLTVRDWAERYAGVMEALTEAKDAGQVRAHGVSCHDFDAFDAASHNLWVDVVLARINYGGHHMDGPPEKIVPVLERMHRKGKGVYGMKVVGQGELEHDVGNAIHYVLDLPCVHAITIGMVTRREVDENVGWVEEHQLAPA